MTSTTFRAVGLPATKGSTKSFAFRRKDGTLGTRTTSANANLKQWELHVRAAAQAAQVPFTPAPLAVHVDVRFFLPMPESLTYLEQVLPTNKLDLDKLARAVLDALTGVAYGDDKQVTRLNCTKRFASRDQPWGVAVGVYGETADERATAAAAVRTAARHARGLPPDVVDGPTLFDELAAQLDADEP